MKLETPETWETQIALKGWFKIIHILFSHSNKETKVERILLKGLYSTKVYSCRITRFQHCFFLLLFVRKPKKDSYYSFFFMKITQCDIFTNWTGSIRKKTGPVNFPTKYTNYEAIFYLGPKRRKTSISKSGISDKIPENKLLIDPLTNNIF